MTKPLKEFLKTLIKGRLLPHWEDFQVLDLQLSIMEYRLRE
jgi:hypothetical protein